MAAKKPRSGSDDVSQDDEEDILAELGVERDEETGELLASEKKVRELGAIDVESIKENRRLDRVVSRKRANEKDVNINAHDLMTKYETLLRMWDHDTIHISVNRITGSPIERVIREQPKSSGELYDLLMEIHGSNEEAKYALKFYDRGSHKIRARYQITLPDTRQQQGQPMVSAPQPEQKQPQTAVPSVEQSPSQTVNPLQQMRDMWQMLNEMRSTIQAQQTTPVAPVAAPPPPPPAPPPPPPPSGADPASMMAWMQQQMMSTMQQMMQQATPAQAPQPQHDPSAMMRWMSETFDRMFEQISKMQRPAEAPAPQPPPQSQTTTLREALELLREMKEMEKPSRRADEEDDDDRGPVRGRGRGYDPRYDRRYDEYDRPPYDRPSYDPRRFAPRDPQPEVPPKPSDPLSQVKESLNLVKQLQTLLPGQENQTAAIVASPEEKEDDSPVRVLDTGSGKIVFDRKDGTLRTWETGLANMDKVFNWVGEQADALRRAQAEARQRQEAQQQVQQLPPGHVLVTDGYEPPEGYVAVPVSQEPPVQRQPEPERPQQQMQQSPLPPPPEHVPPPIQTWQTPSIED